MRHVDLLNIQAKPCRGEDIKITRVNAEACTSQKPFVESVTSNCYAVGTDMSLLPLWKTIKLEVTQSEF